MLFGINDIDMFDSLKGYIIGTTNMFIKTHNKSNCQIFFDLDHSKLEIDTDPLTSKALKPTESEKNWLKAVSRKNRKEGGEADYKEQEESVVWEGSDDSIRHVFAHYFKSLLLDLVDAMTKVFVLHMKIASYNNEVNNACPHSPSEVHPEDSDVSSDFDDMMDKLQNHNYLSYIKK